MAKKYQKQYKFVFNRKTQIINITLNLKYRMFKCNDFQHVFYNLILYKIFCIQFTVYQKKHFSTIRTQEFMELDKSHSKVDCIKTYQISQEIYKTSDRLIVSMKLNSCFIWFNIFQICLTLLLIAIIYFEYVELVSVLESVIAFFIALDMLIDYFYKINQQNSSIKLQKFDCFILIVLVALIILELTYPQQLHHNRDMLAGTIMMVRYGVQAIWLIKLIIETKGIIQTTNIQQIRLEKHEEFQEQIKINVKNSY